MPLPLCRPRSAFTLIELLVVVAIIIAMVSLLMPAVQQARESARRARCQNNLKQLGIALHAYHSSWDRFPNAIMALAQNYPRCDSWVVSRGFSWRVALLPYLDQAAAYQQIDFEQTGFNGCFGGIPGHSSTGQVRSTPMSILLCPSDPTDVNVIDQEQGTNYAECVRARGEIGNGASHGDVRNNSRTRDLGGLTRGGTSLRDFRDGVSQTVLVGEVFRGKKFRCVGFGININQQRCRDWMETTAYCQCNAGVRFDSRLAVTSVNPHQFEAVRRINDPLPDEVSYIDPSNGGNEGYRPMSSAHPGGAQTLLADGSARFVSETINGILWAHLFTRDGEDLAGSEF